MVEELVVVDANKDLPYLLGRLLKTRAHDPTRPTYRTSKRELHVGIETDATFYLHAEQGAHQAL